MPMNDIYVAAQRINDEKTDWFDVLPAELLSTATRTSQEYDSPTGLGILLTVVVANEAGTCSFTPSLVSYGGYGTAITWWTAAAAITANGTYNYLIWPTSITNAAFTEIATIVPFKNWHLVLTYAGTAASDKMDTKARACLL